MPSITSTKIANDQKSLEKKVVQKLWYSSPWEAISGPREEVECNSKWPKAGVRTSPPRLSHSSIVTFSSCTTEELTGNGPYIE